MKTSTFGATRKELKIKRLLIDFLRRQHGSLKAVASPISLELSILA
jgi:hypothetical protein